MNLIRYILRSLKTPAGYLFPVVSLILSLSGTGHTEVIKNIYGNIDLNSINDERTSVVNGTDSLSEINYFNQRYNINWYWATNFTEYVSSRSSLRYSTRFRDNNDVKYRSSDVQPSLELNLLHPDFNLKNNFSRRLTDDDNLPSDLIRDDLSVTFYSHYKDRLPINIRFNYDRIFDRVDTRNNKNLRFVFNTDYLYKGQDFRYNFSRLSSKNDISQLRSYVTNHNFNWSQNSRYKDDRLKFGSYYTFNYNSTVTKTKSSRKIFNPVTVESGYYAEDNSPEFGELDVVAGLTDGVLNNVTVPLIDIGTVMIDRNIGVKLGFGREISALYVYTNVFSDESLIWDVYISDNNLDWQTWESNSQSSFDMLNNRYEIYFSKTSATYVKVVNSGINSVDTVYVTEIQALNDSGDEDINKLSSSSHLVDLNSSYNFSERFRSSANISYNHTSGVYGNDQDYILFYLTGKYQASKVLDHQLRLQVTKQNDGRNSSSAVSESMRYHLRYYPLSTLEFTLSLTDNNSYISGDRISSNKSIYLQSNGNVFPGLNMETAIVYTHYNQLSINSLTTSWNYRLSLDGSFTRQMSFVFSYNYQNSNRSLIDDSRERNQYVLSLNYRLSRAIFLRSKFEVLTEEDKFVSQDYNVNWKLSSRLTVNWQVSVDDRGEYSKIARYSISSNFSIKKRARLTFSYIHNDLSQFSGDDSKIYMVGFRTGF